MLWRRNTSNFANKKAHWLTQNSIWWKSVLISPALIYGAHMPCTLSREHRNRNMFGQYHTPAKCIHVMNALFKNSNILHACIVNENQISKHLCNFSFCILITLKLTPNMKSFPKRGIFSLFLSPPLFLSILIRWNIFNFC